MGRIVPAPYQNWYDPSISDDWNTSWMVLGSIFHLLFSLGSDRETDENLYSEAGEKLEMEAAFFYAWSRGASLQHIAGQVTRPLPTRRVSSRIGKLAPTPRNRAVVEIPLGAGSRSSRVTLAVMLEQESGFKTRRGNLLTHFSIYTLKRNGALNHWLISGNSSSHSCSHMLKRNSNFSTRRGGKESLLQSCPMAKGVMNSPALGRRSGCSLPQLCGTDFWSLEPLALEGKPG